MKTCPKCGKILDESRSNCSYCGTPLKAEDCEASDEDAAVPQQGLTPQQGPNPQQVFNQRQEQYQSRSLSHQNDLVDTQKYALQELRSIHKWVMFFGILTIISLVCSVIAGIVTLAVLT